MTKKELLDKLDAVHTIRSQPIFVVHPEDRGNSMSKRFRRLLRYRGAYVMHILRNLLQTLTILFDSDEVVTTFWGREFVISGKDKDVTARALCESGTLGENELSLTRFLIRELQEDSVFYDIGANYGFYTALAQELIRTGEVHSFEPNQSVFPYLKQLSTHPVRTIMNEIAVSDTSEDINFVDCFSGNSSGKSTTVTEIADMHRWRYTMRVVSATTLDSYCTSHTPPTIIKLDIEGAESRALIGAAQVLQNSSPIIAMELWSGRDLSKFSLDVLSLMERYKYVPFFITDSGMLTETSYSFLREWLTHEQEETNFVFKPTTTQ